MLDLRQVQRHQARRVRAGEVQVNLKLGLNVEALRLLSPEAQQWFPYTMQDVEMFSDLLNEWKVEPSLDQIRVVILGQIMRRWDLSWYVKRAKVRLTT